jgi:wyosine [tRNA(Phe)-imidazoG37] synthetase (radical SAM superfamily)
MIHHIFGPVPSRRLGISLGIDVIPYKVCSLNCVYCECGKTSRLCIERELFVPVAVIVAELQALLPDLGHLDYITFSGSGEPTLYSGLGELVAAIRELTPTPIAVLTNGTLLTRPDVRRDLLQANVVLPSLDAARVEGFARINLPHDGLDIRRIIDGLETFRAEYGGQIWLEVFLLENINDSVAELDALHAAILRIKPERVQLNTIDRPPAFEHVSAASPAFLDSVRQRWSDLPVEIISRTRSRHDIGAYSQNLEHNIVNTIARRPMTLDDLCAMTGLSATEMRPYIDVLEREKKVRAGITGGRIFYSLA